MLSLLPRLYLQTINESVCMHFKHFVKKTRIFEISNFVNTIQFRAVFRWSADEEKLRVVETVQCVSCKALSLRQKNSIHRYMRRHNIIQISYILILLAEIRLKESSEQEIEICITQHTHTHTNMCTNTREEKSDANALMPINHCYTYLALFQNNSKTSGIKSSWKYLWRTKKKTT